LKKRSKKLLLTAGVGHRSGTRPQERKFFCRPAARFFFFKKRSACFLSGAFEHNLANIRPSGVEPYLAIPKVEFP
jgi:hypothetical protein